MGERRDSKSLLDQLAEAEEHSQSHHRYEDTELYQPPHILEEEEDEEPDDFLRFEEDMGYEDVIEPRNASSSANNSLRVGSLFQDAPLPSAMASGSSAKRSSFQRSVDFSDEFLVPSTRTPSFNNSAPALERRSPLISPGGVAASSPLHDSQMLRRERNNRVALFDSSPTTSEAGSSSNLAANTTRGGRLMKSLLGRKSTFRGRFPNRNHTSTTIQRSSPKDPMIEAVSRLGTTSNDHEHVAAAAAVVSATVVAATAAKRGGSLFSRGDHTLVMLTLLGMSDREGQRDLYTVDPVNAHGYPLGEGKTDVQKQGPYMYVLCIVTEVHFDEDERYYTVRRCDTGAKQRADPAMMEPIDDEEAIEVALRAAKRCQRTMHEGPESVTPEAPSWITQVSRFWMNWWVGTVVPNYVRSRNAIKRRVMSFLDGDPGYGIRLHFSGINFLVLCSLVFLFEDVVTLAFSPPGFDTATSTIGIVVWVILVLELVFEVLLRPRNYQELILSDKSFLPSTARHINTFHLVFESLALILFLPQVVCMSEFVGCAEHPFLSRARAPLYALTSHSGGTSILGRLDLSLTFLRAFGLVRHWKQMWINNAFQEEIRSEPSFIRKLLFVKDRRFLESKKFDDENSTSMDGTEATHPLPKESSEDRLLKNAASIGTALMILNSHRALSLLLLIVCSFPLLYSVMSRNTLLYQQASFLQATNLAASTTSDCNFLQDSVRAWISQASYQTTNPSILQQVQWVQLLPVRCDWQEDPFGYLFCDSGVTQTIDPLCAFSAEDFEFFAKKVISNSDARASAFSQVEFKDKAASHNGTNAEFSVRVLYNESKTITIAYYSLFLLLLGFVMTALLGMSVMRADAERLVLFPLTKMLMIIVRYAENPLSTPTSQLDEGGKEELGQYETEQLINAIAKIADLLRKCWGVAGADIISSNLARTKDGKTVVFNPTIPGKQVYALFGFVGINDFSKQLRMLEKDVMILINDVARVVHDEVYRWGHSSSGQCNKNLGSAFLMVFRIGDFLEVHDKKKRATDVVFNSQMKNVKVKQRQNTQNKRRSSGTLDMGNNGTLQLASLPGIQAFADRALLGFLKSFAGLHRDHNMQNWQTDLRLGAGVGRYKIDVLYGMDAGWAVEGAVGSEYKIDATYLSPHVNMASRMMSACKQYGVKVLLSQAVEELLSKQARSKMRHLDTVYVKGSNVEQRIYTYDARHDGVDFFLFEKAPDQADVDADAYNPSIWELDQDLKSMRQHVTDEFMETFHAGVEKYLAGQWKEAVRKFQKAETLMFEEVVEQGFVEYMNEDLGEYGKITSTSREEVDRLKEEYGDGASRCLIQFMQKRNCIPPPDWHGVRHLMSK